MDAIKLLQEQLDSKSLTQVSQELGISKTSVSLLSNNKYPNPQKMHEKIIDKYGSKQEIIGVESKTDLKELAKELGCI